MCRTFCQILQRNSLSSKWVIFQVNKLEDRDESSNKGDEVFTWAPNSLKIPADIFLSYLPQSASRDVTQCSEWSSSGTGSTGGWRTLNYSLKMAHRVVFFPQSRGLAAFIPFLLLCTVHPVPFLPPHVYRCTASQEYWWIPRQLLLPQKVWEYVIALYEPNWRCFYVMCYLSLIGRSLELGY